MDYCASNCHIVESLRQRVFGALCRRCRSPPSKGSDPPALGQTFSADGGRGVGLLPHPFPLKGKDVSSSDYQSQTTDAAAGAPARNAEDMAMMAMMEVVEDDEDLESLMITEDDAEDSDVLKEAQRVREKSRMMMINNNNNNDNNNEGAGDDNTCGDAIIIKGLRKDFDGSSSAAVCLNKLSKLLCVCSFKKPTPAKQAVKDLWFSIPEGQCFGFLGVNGAGKTTTVKMLTGALPPSGGTATLVGWDITKHPSKVREFIGYCPQFDSLFDYMTGREHIHFYCRLALLPKSTYIPLTEEVLAVLGLSDHANKLIKSYSGGNMRKLSVGLAFIGDPRVVFLDEPSSGVDPESKRKLWNAISRTTAEAKRAVILTTHSMEECEALCDRLAIMQNGKLACIGTPSQLKAKFGAGYQVDVSFNIPEVPAASMFHRIPEGGDLLPGAEEFRNVLLQRFPKSLMLETVGRHQRWSIPKSKVSIADVFRVLEDQKARMHIQVYSVSDASLESIFVGLQTSAKSRKRGGGSDTAAKSIMGNKNDASRSFPSTEELLWM